MLNVFLPVGSSHIAVAVELAFLPAAAWAVQSAPAWAVPASAAEAGPASAGLAGLAWVVACLLRPAFLLAPAGPVPASPQSAAAVAAVEHTHEKGCNRTTPNKITWQ